MLMQFASRGRNAGKSFWGCSRYPACRGTRNADGEAVVATSKKKAAAVRPPVRSNRATTLARGDLLVSSANTFGPGKLVAKEGDELVLAYFNAPGPSPDEQYRESVPRSSLKRLELSPELRVFWRDRAQRWRSGRIIETNPHGDIYVRGHEWEGFLSQEQLYVRWDRPLDDPVGFGAAGMLESPLLADMRRPFLQSILRQRSAAHGMKGAISSCIELHAHQVETAWRVLQDPIQRYLLADEVGLGKTIEAGMVLRQMLLDNPGLSAQMILPPFLVDQWRRELRDKFRVQDFPSAEIRLGRDDEPETWDAADVVIVDEAHHLARMADSNDASLAARFARLEEVALNSPRLLLLSATPALHNEQAFLAMLRLLDPALHRHTTVTDLRERLEARAGLGRLFLGLQPGLPGVLLRSRFAEIASTFADDDVVVAHTAAGERAIAAKDDIALAQEIGALRAHVAEVYRVHRRMLRTRRTAALKGTYQVTGREEPAAITLNSTLSRDVTHVLENWRQQALAVVEGDAIGLRLAGRALASATALSLDPSGLCEWASQQSPTDRGERTALELMSSDLRLVDRRASISRPFVDALSYLFDAKQRVVVFCPSTSMAAEVASEMRKFLATETVMQHLATDSSEDTEKAVRAFEESRSASVMVADSSAEEGRNFQFADLLVHMGVPAGANRLEQRIGRLDRWDPSRGEKVWRSYVLREVGDEGSYSHAWHRILSEGFGVFGSSIASLQQAVDEATDEAWAVLFERGPTGTDQAITQVRDTLAAEREKVREQDALDSLESSSDERSVFHQMTVVEEEADAFAALSNDLLSRSGAQGNLRFEPIGDPVRRVGGYEVLARFPGRNAQIPLIPAWRLKRDFLPLRGHSGTFVRDVATSRRDVRLYRYGDHFIDAVSDFLTNDDRGRAFGMWRWIPSWARAEAVLYRFDYAIEANPLEVLSANDPRAALAAINSSEAADRLAVCRRADGIFPPLILTVWLDAKGRSVSSRTHLDAVAAPYAKPVDAHSGGDYALNRKRIERAYELVSEERWAADWRASEAEAQHQARGSEATRTAVDRATTIAERETTSRLAQLQLRVSRTAGDERRDLEKEIRREEVISSALSTAITTPSLRLDSTGVVILSGRGLETE